jgi:phosphoglucosamine mutase
LTAARKLFGTDGVRGVAGVDLTVDLARALGAAAVRVTGPGATIAIGRDTRESGPGLDEALGEGIAAAGGNAIDLGVLPTPGVAVLARELSADLGCVISASHNPYQDNGIKFLGGDGRKLSDALEAGIEEAMEGPEPGGGGREAYPHADERYVDWLAETFGDAVDTSGELVVDCANGAASAVAPWLFEAVGVRTHVIGNEPDGRNINLGVGSTHLDALAGEVAVRNAAGGLAFDGDADRCLGVDDAGRTVNGDAIVAVLALDRKARGELPGNRVVVTSMTNLGFHRLMREHGIEVEVTDVGDRYVVERMLALGAPLGGEQSGHVVDLERHTTGDGLATSLMLLAALNRLGMTPADAAGLVASFPQRLVAVKADRSLLPSADRIWQEVDAVSENLGDRGRVVLRASGTEPVVRVMVEAEDAAECERVCEALADMVRAEIGV